MPFEVLVVDDDPALCELIKDLLDGEGYRVRCAGDGLSALAEIERARPDLVVTDFQMPRLDGMGLLQRLQERGIRIPVVMMSAVRHPTWPADIAFVAKPFDIEELLGTIATVLDDNAA